MRQHTRTHTHTHTHTPTMQHERGSEHRELGGGADIQRRYRDELVSGDW